MDQVSLCPNDAALDELLSGAAAPDTAEAFARHLELCLVCAERFDRSLARDGLLEAMEAQGRRPDPAASPAVQVLIQKFISLRTADETPTRSSEFEIISTGEGPAERPGF